MKITVLAILAIMCVTGCATVPWQSRTYPDHEAVARVLYDQAMALTVGKIVKTSFVPLLQDKRTLFVDDVGREVTVRDLAFTMLDEADLVELPVSSTRSKLICSCLVRGELFRFHVPELTDENFRTVIEAIQRTPGGHSQPAWRGSRTPQE